jgi:hypothetical protein
MRKLISSIFLVLLVSGCTFSEGERTGTIVKFSKKGVLFKTWEGELATLAIAQRGTALSNSFTFTVDDERIVEKIRELMKVSEKLTLTYEEEFFVFPWEGDTKYFITDVNIIKGE